VDIFTPDGHDCSGEKKTPEKPVSRRAPTGACTQEEEPTWYEIGCKLHPIDPWPTRPLEPQF
jgi:hypothetical protein